ncbi:glycoside hydrolase [Coprinellus micaceus]|uniref:Endo-1,4-beta-xylanase n=1 Tax=Coprinellus micaceus TaxID=71717 RepID=A0A4Y7SFX2_COPMI|nr:glycoside hydrolase [Coprinellus micaceus]
MVFLSFLAFICLLPLAFSAPGQLFERLGAPSELDRRAGTFFSNWREGGGNFQCNNLGGGTYTTNWSGQGGFVCGLGYNPGGNRVIRYNGTYTPTGPGYLALYGWTRNPLIEYYVIESYDVLAPGEPWTLKGNFTFEEGTYVLYTSTRVNKPSIEGTRTFQQYWSVRTEKRVGGTISAQKHFDAWRSVGLNFGYHDYQILATEGFTNGAQVSSGSSRISVDV